MSGRTRSAPLPDVATRHDGRALLQVWLSPSFPIGAFAYSHGLEKAADNGWVVNRATLEAWLLDLIAHGGLHNDLILMSSSYRCALAGDVTAHHQLADLSAALQPSAERYLEATQQGQSFLAQIDTTWPLPQRRLADIFAATCPTLPVVLGAAAQAHRIPRDDTALAFAVSFTSNLVSAAIRLSLVGQTDGQRVLATVMPALAIAVERADAATLLDLGGAAFRSDIASMQHETQYTRLFRS